MVFIDESGRSMRFVFMMTGLLLLGGAHVAQAAEPVLHCPQSQDPAIEKLCRAIGKGLSQTARSGEDGGARLILDADMPHPGLLRASLSVERGQIRQQSETLQLSISDRATASDRGIESLARTLLSQVNLPGKE